MSNNSNTNTSKLRRKNKKSTGKLSPKLSHHVVPLECVFYAEFDNELGPVVLYCAPEEYEATELLKQASDYVICPNPLCNKIVSVCVGAKKIVGFPLYIEDSKYGRNKLSFNFCFVFRRETDARPWYPLVRKLASTVYAMEIESEFLYKEASKTRLKKILIETRNQLNLQARCVLPLDNANMLSLKLFHILPDPSSVRDHDVPVRVRELGTSITSEWDLTLQQILPYVDGVRFVKRISLDAGVEVALVKHCVRQLLYYGCVSLVDIFQYSNIYTTGRRVNLLASNQEFGRQCVAYVTKRSMAKPLISKVFSLYCSMDPSTRLADFCLTHDTNSLHIDDRRFVTFGLIHGLIRRVHEYPIYLPSNDTSNLNNNNNNYNNNNNNIYGGNLYGSSYNDNHNNNINTNSNTSSNKNNSQSDKIKIEALKTLADGTRSIDEICVELLCSRKYLNNLLKNNLKVLLLPDKKNSSNDPQGFVVQK